MIVVNVSLLIGSAWCISDQEDTQVMELPWRNRTRGALKLQ